MDFPSLLIQVLSCHDDSNNNNNNNNDDESGVVDRLVTCNDAVEELFGNPTRGAVELEETSSRVSLVEQASDKLKTVLQQERKAQQQQQQQQEASQSVVDNKSWSPRMMALYLRSAKNLLRFKLQFPTHPTMAAAAVAAAAVMTSKESKLSLQCNEMLDLYMSQLCDAVSILSSCNEINNSESNHVRDDNFTDARVIITKNDEEDEVEEILRHATLSIFYGAYGNVAMLNYVVHPHPSSSSSHTTNYNTDNDSYLDVLARILRLLLHPLLRQRSTDTNTSITTTKIALLLGQCRLLHHVLVMIKDFDTECWKYNLLHKSPNNNNKDTSEDNPDTNLHHDGDSIVVAHDETNSRILPLVLMDVLDWCITTATTSTTSVLPSTVLIADHKKLEVATELLRILYVLRAGRILSPSIVTKVLHSPKCRLDVIPLLMDSNVVTQMLFVPSQEVDDDDDDGEVDDLLTQWQSIFWDILVQQVTLVVDHTLVGSSAVSALTPILTLLRLLCQNSIDFCVATQEFIFPNPIPNQTTTSTTTNTTANTSSLLFNNNNNNNKMSPSDAPRGTLRYQCIQLLTWTEAHVKRCMAELLYVLCEEQPSMYVTRVGLGNAVPLLQAKGFITNQT